MKQNHVIPNKKFNKYLNSINSLVQRTTANKIVTIGENGSPHLVADGFIKASQIFVDDTKCDVGEESYSCEALCYFIWQDDLGYENEEDDSPFIVKFRLYVDWQSQNWVLKIINPRKLINKAIKFFAIQNQSLFITALEQYLQYKYYKANESQNLIYSFSGWKYNADNKRGHKKDFIGVTEESFNIDFEKVMRLSNYEKDYNERDITAGLDTIEKFMFGSELAVMIFLYNILSICKEISGEIISEIYSEFGIKDYIGRLMPTFCLYGEHSKISKNAVANLLINWFQVNPLRLNTIKKGNIGNVMLDSSYTFNISRKPFHDMPFIVSRKRGLIRSDHGKIRKIIGNNLIEFPFFISNNEIKLEEVINFNIENINDFPFDRESQIEIRNAVDDILFNFIWFLHTLDEEDIEFKRVYRRLKEDANLFLNNDGYNETDSHFAVTLITAGEIFALFISSVRKRKLASQFLDIVKKYLAKNVLPYHIEGKNESLIKQFLKYINCVFLDEIDILHWEGVERNGKREECYYIDYDRYFFSFSNWLEKDIPQSEWNSLLKESGIIKLRSDKSSMGQYRVYKGKNNYVLVILKHKLK